MYMDDDFNFEDLKDLENKKIRWDYKNLKESGVDFWTIFLLRVAPIRGIKRLSRKMGIDPDIADKAHSLFANSERVDIIPSNSGKRGFQIVINSSTALYFYQDGDHFVYDGWESGEYEKGDVTIFDNLDNPRWGF